MNLNKKNMKQIMFLIVFSAFMLWLVYNYSLFIDLAGFIIKLVMPLIVGIAIAFIINVPMKQLEKKIFKINKRKHKKLIRIISLLLSIILIFGIIILIMFLVIPEFIEAIISISKSIPKSYEWVNNIINKASDLYPGITNQLKNINIKSLIDSSVNTAGSIISIIISFLSVLISRLVILFLGFIISIYILIDKENLSRKTKKLIMAFFGKEVTVRITNIVKLANFTFTNFLTGQCLDACLTGFEFFVILSLIKMPYALILGVLFAITALIPYIGAFITLIIGVVLVAVSSPINALWYIVVFFVVQQFDDNFTYPRIVGSSVGLPALWALIAVLIGGSIFGFIGMIISIPLASILYSLLKDFVNARLEDKKINDIDK